MKLAAAGLATLLMLGGCANFGDADYAVTIQNQDGNFPVHIYDTAKLLATADDWPTSDPGYSNEGAIADPAHSQVDIGWVGGVCQRDTVIHLDGDATNLTVTVQPNQQAQLPIPLFESCSAVGIFLGVKLTLTTPLTQDHLHYVLDQ